MTDPIQNYLEACQAVMCMPLTSWTECERAQRICAFIRLQAKELMELTHEVQRLRAGPVALSDD